MLAYAPRPTGRAGSPRTLFLVGAGHVAALALVLTARSDYVGTAPLDPPDVIFVKPIKPPPPPPPPSSAEPRQPSQSTIDRPTIIVPTPRPTIEPLTDGPPINSIDRLIGNAVVPPPLPVPQPIPAIVRKAPRFATPADRIRPPYPDVKRRQEEEASLRLSLSIDARGRVTAVAPVGAADAVFLDAARRHIVRHWRYQPASEGGTAVASMIVVTLTFTLED